MVEQFRGVVLDKAVSLSAALKPSLWQRHRRHVDTRVHYLRELVRDGHVKLLKCAGPQNVADALTQSLPRPALSKHRQYMWGTRIPFSAFYLSFKTDGVLQRHHTMRIPSRTRRLRNISSVYALVCMCCCVSI